MQQFDVLKVKSCGHYVVFNHLMSYDASLTRPKQTFSFLVGVIICSSLSIIEKNIDITRLLLKICTRHCVKITGVEGTLRNIDIIESLLETVV